MMREGTLLPVRVFFVAVFLVLGCVTENHLGEDKVGIVVSIPPQADFVERVGGERVQVTVMVPSGASAHSYEPTPRQLEAVSKARIYFKVGSGVEFEQAWMDRIKAMNPDIIVIDGSEGITLVENDPHIWNSPANARRMVENLYSGIIQADPDNAREYARNRDDYILELESLDSYIHDRFNGFSNRVFMTYHPSWEYLAEEYNLTEIAIEQEGKKPTPQVIRKCVDNARGYNLSYVYVAPQFSAEAAEAIAYEIGGHTVVIDPLPRNYIDNMRGVADSLALEFE